MIKIKVFFVILRNHTLSYNEYIGRVKESFFYGVARESDTKSLHISVTPKKIMSFLDHGGNKLGLLWYTEVVSTFNPALSNADEITDGGRSFYMSRVITSNLDNSGLSF